MNGEQSYLSILKDIHDHGVEKIPTRDGEVVNGTIMLPCKTFHHNMSHGFPALTTRKVAFRSSMVELEGFIHGITDKKWYQARKCHFWDHWASPPYVNQAIKQGKEKSQAQKDERELGPIYGYQWRIFNDASEDEGGDQLKAVVDKLKTNPYDRRLIVSAWNPLQIELMALPPCHILFQVVTYQDKLDLIWYQRSADFPIGVPHNITFYGMLLLLLAKTAGFQPNNLFGVFGDAHIYKNQIPGVKEQLSRTPSELPQVRFPNTVLDGEFDFFNWTHKDVELVNYNPQSKINFELTV